MTSKLAVMIGHVIKQKRTQAGITLRAFEGMSYSHLSDIERAKKNPQLSTIEYICEQMDVPMSEFLHEVADYMKELEDKQSQQKSYAKTEHGVTKWYKT